MLLVKTTVKPSKIAGVGLFAAEDIEEGKAVWQYTPQTCILITKEQFQELLQSYHKTEKELIQYLLIYTYYQEKLKGLVLCLDNGRFVNHSEEPNMHVPLDMPKKISWQYSVACRHIKRGEELTEDYRTYDSLDWLDTLCRKYKIFHERKSHK